MANTQELHPNIPILNLSTKRLNPGSSSWIEACKNARHGLEEYGLFIAIYDDVSDEFDAQVFDALEELFDLPIETKTKNTSDLVFYGYVGQLPHAPLHESLGIPDATSLDSVQNFTDLMWPSGNKKFSETIQRYVEVVSELEKRVDRMVFESYGAEKHYESHIKSTTYLLRTIKYSVPEYRDEDGTTINNVGANIHTDKSFLTIIHQNKVDGLQIQLKNSEEWFSLKVPHASFVVMSGDAYQAWSNGRIHAARHQVIIKEEKPRYCLALFSFNHGITEIPEQVVDSEHPLQFKPFDNFGLARFYLSGASEMTESTARVYCGLAN